MAIVIAIEKDDRNLRAAHPTQLVCKYIVEEHDGKRILQLNSYGSAGRDIPGKLSQTLQFTEASAFQLFRILQAEFGFKD
ncbi:hypothetical protein [Phaeovulum sp.]|uniref:hypothetical protein n=1 Tax=Phaeovulum sp. TaxID=2934796 RepID=UPI0039E526F7